MRVLHSRTQHADRPAVRQYDMADRQICSYPVNWQVGRVVDVARFRSAGLLSTNAEVRRGAYARWQHGAESGRRVATPTRCRAWLPGIAVDQCNELVGLAAWQHGGMAVWRHAGRAGTRVAAYAVRRRPRTGDERKSGEGIRRPSSRKDAVQALVAAASHKGQPPAPRRGLWSFMARPTESARKWAGLLACRVAAPPAMWGAAYARCRSFVTSCAGRGRLQSCAERQVHA